jgi:hypothetical protein
MQVTFASKEIKVKQIMEALEGKGYPALLVLFSLPCSFPVQIPGFSTPFGIFLAFLGFRIAFLKHMWWPKWVLERKFSSAHTLTVVKKTKKAVIFMQKVVKPRLTYLVTTPILARINGFVIFILALFLALPLPIPLSNLLSAIPILAISLGILEEDGVMILIGYALSILCVYAFSSLFFFGVAEVKSLVN